MPLSTQKMQKSNKKASKSKVSTPKKQHRTTTTRAWNGNNKSKEWLQRKQETKNTKVSIVKHEGKDPPTKIAYFDDQNSLFW